MECQQHPQRAGAYQCTTCNQVWCDGCTQHKDFGGTMVDLCPECGDQALPVGGRSRDAPDDSGPAGAGGFFRGIPAAFGFPFRDDGWIMIVFLVLLSAATAIMALVPLYGFLPSAFLGGWFVAFLFRIINTSANGDESMPDWPELTDMFGTVVVPLFQIMVALFLVAIPAVVIRIYLESQVAFTVAIVAGTIYLPMAFLGIARDGSIVGFNPVRGIASIAKIPLQYAVAVAAVGLIGVLSSRGTAMVAEAGFLGDLVARFGSFYFTVVEARILGLLYFHNQSRLSWFGER